jgi:hypothetical protein
MESTASIAGSGKPPVRIDQVGWADNREGSAGLTLNSRGVAGPEPAILAEPVQGEWSIMQSCNGKMDQHPIKETPTDARQAVKVRAMRYVLGFGLARGVTDLMALRRSLSGSVGSAGLCASAVKHAEGCGALACESFCESL